jgi:thioredoxin reductase (NADPH)
MRPLKNRAQVAVIGGGIAGLAAAAHAARLGSTVTIFERAGLFGGLVATVGEVDGLITAGDPPSGQDLAMLALQEAQHRGVSVIERNVEEVILGGRISLRDDEGDVYRPEAVIVASGASLRALGVSGEKEFDGRGISHCATCDGGFFRDREVVVVGGGDGAAQEALVLTTTARLVTLVCRGKIWKAKREYREQLAKLENVKLIFGYEVTSVLGDDTVSGVQLRDTTTGASSELSCSGIFAFVGTTPNTAFLPKVMRTRDGYVKTISDVHTADRCIFAVGAVRQGYGGHVVQAMADGITAATAAAAVVAL